jgi:hypothetical protein
MKISVEVMLSNTRVGEVTGEDAGISVRLYDIAYAPTDWEKLKSAVDAALAQCARAREAALR